MTLCPSTSGSPRIAGVCLLTCLPQGCHTKSLGFERMQKMGDNTTQHCHRLAATQPARPILAYPPPPPRWELQEFVSRGLINGEESPPLSNRETTNRSG